MLSLEAAEVVGRGSIVGAAVRVAVEESVGTPGENEGRGDTVSVAVDARDCVSTPCSLGALSWVGVALLDGVEAPPFLPPAPPPLPLLETLELGAAPEAVADTVPLGEEVEVPTLASLGGGTSVTVGVSEAVAVVDGEKGELMDSKGAVDSLAKALVVPEVKAEGVRKVVPEAGALPAGPPDRDPPEEALARGDCVPPLDPVAPSVPPAEVLTLAAPEALAAVLPLAPAEAVGARDGVAPPVGAADWEEEEVGVAAKEALVEREGEEVGDLLPWEDWVKEGDPVAPLELVEVRLGAIEGVAPALGESRDAVGVEEGTADTVAPVEGVAAPDTGALCVGALEGEGAPVPCPDAVAPLEGVGPKLPWAEGVEAGESVPSSELVAPELPVCTSTPVKDTSGEKVGAERAEKVATRLCSPDWLALCVGLDWVAAAEVVAVDEAEAVDVALLVDQMDRVAWPLAVAVRVLSSEGVLC